jgi:rubrerythrin
MGASEAVQARRLLNSLIGRIDTSGGYLETIFAEEIPAVLENYTELINNTKAERPALLQAISQLRAAEKRLRSLYSQQNRDVKIKKNAKYFVCYFCGYLDTDSPPEKCPICGAARDAFRETN